MARAASKTKKRKANVRGLSQIETDIMKLVWQFNKTTVREVHEVMLKNGYIPYTTVMAAMNNLWQKGVLNQSRRDKAYIYSPAISNTDMANQIIDYMVEKILGGSSTTILGHLLKIKNKDEVEELIRLSESLDSQVP